MNSFQYEPEGVYIRGYFCLQVDGPITWWVKGGGGYKFGGLSVISYRGVISQVEKVVITRGKFPLF